MSGRYPADWYSNDEAGAAGWEHRFGPLFEDPIPTRAELDAEEEVDAGVPA